MNASRGDRQRRVGSHGAPMEFRQQIIQDSTELLNQVLTASVGSSVRREELRKGYKGWATGNANATESYIRDKVKIRWGRDPFFLEDPNRVIPGLTARLYYADRLTPTENGKADQKLRELLVERGVYDSDDCWSFLYLVSERIREMDEGSIRECSQGKDFRKLSEYFFKQYAREGENYNEATLLWSFGKGPQKNWAKRVEGCVLWTISNSRAVLTNAIPYAEMPAGERGMIDDAQRLMVEDFPEVMGCEYPFDLRGITFFSRKASDHADSIANRVILKYGLMYDPLTVRRLAVHEGLHLAGKSEDQLRMLDLEVLPEGLNEWTTNEIMLRGFRAGKVPYTVHSRTHMEYVSDLNAVLFGGIFQGDTKPYIEFFREGDLGKFVGRIRQGLATAGITDLKQLYNRDLYCFTPLKNDLQTLIDLKI